MTRWLSDALEAQEPAFRLGLQRLEAASGHPNHDIRFSTAVQQATKAKILELGLDPNDTTASELYHVLLERVKADDQKLVKRLRTEAALNVSADGNVVDGLAQVVRQAAGRQSFFALKSAKLKTLLKQQPPKKAMKRLGYRSLDSLLKHEAPAAILTAAWFSEGVSWQKHVLDQYKKLRASDFENRRLNVLRLSGRRWQQLATEIASAHQHNLVSFKELATLVLLPMPDEAPEGSTTVSLALALHEINEIRAGSTFLKLSQVRSDFGEVVKTVARDEPRLTSQLLDQAVPWHLIQRFYARLTHQFDEALYGPHIRADDMSWRGVEEAMAEIEPSFSFWQQTGHLGLLHGRQVVSFNLIDSALSYCNGRAFEQRISHYFKHSLWHELLLHYLQRVTVEQTVLAELQPALASESVEPNSI
ncbi:MAG TPA: hypothetical protein VHB51_02765 [Candidatus Saccharimonadales bacterium]|nr:hypothetical protein [Candidatus Saccharimonadales bacterium]